MEGEVIVEVLDCLCLVDVGVVSAEQIIGSSVVGGALSLLGRIGIEAFEHVLVGLCHSGVGLVVVQSKKELTLGSVEETVVVDLGDSHVDILEAFLGCFSTLGSIFLKRTGQTLIAACHREEVVGGAVAHVEIFLVDFHSFVVLTGAVVNGAELGKKIGSFGYSVRKPGNKKARKKKR